MFPVFHPVCFAGLIRFEGLFRILIGWKRVQSGSLISFAARVFLNWLSVFSFDMSHPSNGFCHARNVSVGRHFGAFPLDRGSKPSHTKIGAVPPIWTVMFPGADAKDLLDTQY
jgi:hypothetical protein